jgi:DNA-binding HxlR family transcriptional regulator
MKRVRYQSAPERFEYRLTGRGADLYPSMVTMMAWGDRWRAGPEGPPLVLVHNACGNACSTMVVCSQCAAPIVPRDVTYRDGPAAGIDHEYPRVNTRRLSRPENFLRGRPCSVARTLEVIGDRWTFLLIRQAFLGVHRFEKVRRSLGISTNILADRLQRLVEFGIFDRRLYSTTPARHEYRFTDKGRDLYASMIALMRWGDDWLWENARVPMILHHKPCGEDFRPLVVCTECRVEIAIRDMSYRPGPGADPGETVAGTDDRVELVRA